MCMLTYFPPDTMPNTDRLYNGAVTNDDGHGYAIVAGNEIIVGKSMNARTAIEEFEQARAFAPSGPALFHSRFSTHGVVDESNIHPFSVCNDDRTVLAHNGILPDSCQPRKGDTRSDTRIAAEVFLRKAFGPLYSFKARRRIEKWMGEYNKLVILSTHRAFRQSAYILNEAAGIWADGIWYSNSGYLPYRYITKTYAYGGWGWEDGKYTVRHSADGEDEGTPVKCYACLAVSSPGMSECVFCGWCFDCQAGSLGQCECYVPPSAMRHIIGKPKAIMAGPRVDAVTGDVDPGVAANLSAVATGTGWPEEGPYTAEETAEQAAAFNDAIEAFNQDRAREVAGQYALD